MPSTWLSCLIRERYAFTRDLYSCQVCEIQIEENNQEKANTKKTIQTFPEMKCVALSCNLRWQIWQLGRWQKPLNIFSA